MELYEHQIRGIERGRDRNMLYAWSCGLGKTAATLHHIDRLRREGVGPGLVVAPRSILRAAWLADAKKFFPHLRSKILWGKSTTERIRNIRSNYDLGIINYESLRIKAVFDAIAERRFQVVVLDESSRIKSYRSQTTKAGLALAGFRLRGSPYRCPTPAVRRYALSATPAPNTPEEWWPQIAFVCGPEQMPFSTNFYCFRAAFFHRVPLGLTGQALWRFRESMRPEFEAKLKPWVDVVRKRDALDLPEQIHQVRDVTLSEAEQRTYDDFRRDLVLRFKDVEILGDSVLKEIMKLRQLTSGFCYTDTGAVRIGDSKLRELLSLLEEIGKDESVIVWSVFSEEKEQILAALGKRAVALYGKTKDREAVIDDFTTGRAKVLVCNPRAAGHGLTLTRASYVVYYSLSYSLELYLQSMDRNHRIGQNRTCFYYYLTVPGSIDEVLLNTLRKKQRVADATLSYLKGPSHVRRIAS